MNSINDKGVDLRKDIEGEQSYWVFETMQQELILVLEQR